MRRLLILIFTTLLINGLYAQDEKLDKVNSDSIFFYSAIVKVDSVFKDELYKRAKRWLSISCDEIKYDDNFELVCNGHFKRDYEQIYYSIRVLIKDEFYKYEIGDIRIRRSVDTRRPTDYMEFPIQFPEMFNKNKQKYYKRIYKDMKAFILRIDEAMKSPITYDW